MDFNINLEMQNLQCIIYHFIKIRAQLLSWKDDENSKWNFKTNNLEIINSEVREKYAMRHTKNNFISETRDQFGKLHNFLDTNN